MAMSLPSLILDVRILEFGGIEIDQEFWEGSLFLRIEIHILFHISN